MHKRLFLILLLFIKHGLFSQISTAQSDSNFEQGKELFAKGKYQESKEKFLLIIRKNALNDSAAYFLGRINLNQGRPDESIEWFKKAVAINDSSSAYYHQLGLAYGLKAQRAGIIKKAGLAKKMKINVEKAVNLDSQNIEARFSLINYYIQAPKFMGGGLDKAKLQAEEIKKIDEYNGHIALATVYESENNYDLAENELIQMIQNDSVNTDNYLRLGSFYSRNGKYPEAINIFEKIISINPENMDAYYQIGKAGALSGIFLEKAESNMQFFLKNAQEVDENYIIWAYYRLGMIYEKSGKMDQAKESYQAVLDLDPKMKLAENALKKWK